MYNTKRHLISIHNLPKNLLLYEEWKKNKEKEKQERKDAKNNSFKISVSSKLNKNGSKHKNFVDKCAKWVAMNNRPLHIVEDMGFRLLMGEVAPKYNAITRFAVFNRLQALKQAVEEKLLSELAHACAVSITTDVWTDSTGSSYASFTVHFVDSKWTLVSYLLACSKLKGKHTGSELSRFLVSTAKSYKILKKILFVSVDNASNAKLQVELSAEQESLLFEIATEHENEGLSTVGRFSDSFADLPAPENDKGELFEGSLDDADNSDMFISELQLSAELVHPPGDNSELHLKNCRATLNRMPCAAHTLQLCIRTALDSAAVSQVVALIRQTSNFFRKSAVGWSYLEQAQVNGGRVVVLRLGLDVKTRWGSTLFMVKRYLIIRHFVDEAVARLYSESFSFGQLRPCVPLKSTQIQALKSCVGLLTLAESATGILGRENEPSIHVHDKVLSRIISECKKHESKTQPGTCSYQLASSLRREILTRRTKHCREATQAIVFFHVASLLSPSYKAMNQKKDLPDYPYSDVHALLIVAHIVRTVSPEALEQALDNSAVEAPARKKQKVSSLLLDDDENTIHLSKGTGKVSMKEALRREFDSFMMVPAIPADEEGSCPLLFWKEESNSGRYRLLSLIAKFVFATPVTSTSSERVFSTAGMIRQKTERVYYLRLRRQF